ncbi:hypothetical protein VAE122_3040362 [Vibrio aestuarianus]|nr:hypothetical protein VAE122_3040362 [Vibrio aestuarianus]
MREGYLFTQRVVEYALRHASDLLQSDLLHIKSTHLSQSILFFRQYWVSLVITK